jgi:glycosyltransferase involved in cell wall biosynthesis
MHSRPTVAGTSGDHDPTKEKVKQLNMKTIYQKDDTNIASLHVAVPTTAQEQGGTEFRLFVTVISLLLIFLSPFVTLAYSIIQSIIQVEEIRFVSSVVSLALFILPMFNVYGLDLWRYSTNSLVISWVLRLRTLLLPILFPLSLCSPQEMERQYPIFLSLSLGISLIVFILRMKCKAEVPVDGKLRILIIADALPPKVDGVCTFAENAVDTLKPKHEIQLITSIQGPKTLFGCQVTRLPGMETPISPGHSITLPLPTVMFEFIKFRPHVVHLFEVSPLNLATFFYCHICDIPCTFSHHTRLDLYINIVTPQFPQKLNAFILYSLERFFYPLPDAHLCVSKVLFEKVKNRGTRNVKFWHSGVQSRFDKTKFSVEMRRYLTGKRKDIPVDEDRNARRSQSSLEDDDEEEEETTSDGFSVVPSQEEEDYPLVIHVGRLGPEKNSEEIPEIMYETFKLMNGRVKFAIIGDGILRPQVEAELKAKNIPCVFPGFLRGLPLEQAYASADLFFSPSTTEGFPLVFLEAMASGLCVVGPIAGGVPDEFSEGVEGCLYAPHDTKSCAEAIKRALLSGGKEMKSKAYAKGKSFTWESSIEELESSLKFVVEQKVKADAQFWGN